MGNNKQIKQKEKTHNFTFDHVFNGNCTQKQIYEASAKPVIEYLLEGRKKKNFFLILNVKMQLFFSFSHFSPTLGYNGTVFVYGQTSSGKTHTMQGPDIEDDELKGIIPRMVQDIFDTIQTSKENEEFLVQVSYLEIYRERICDLIDSNSKKKQTNKKIINFFRK